MLIPRTPSDWLVSDTLRIDESTRAGTLTRAAWSAWLGDELEHDLVLERRGHAYRIAGAVKGKAVAATVASRQGLPDDIEVAHMVAAAARAGGPWPVRVPQWVPEASPLEVMDTELGRHAGGAMPCRFRTGPIEARLAVDGSGMPKAVELTGSTGIVIGMERVFSRGSL